MDLSFGSLFSNIIISCLGMALLMYGKKAQRPVPLFCGLAMCIYPYFIPSVLVMWIITLALLYPIWHFRNS
jgi:hypothetical protein